MELNKYCKMGLCVPPVKINQTTDDRPTLLSGKHPYKLAEMTCCFFAARKFPEQEFNTVLQATLPR